MEERFGIDPLSVPSDASGPHGTFDDPEHLGSSGESSLDLGAWLRLLWAQTGHLRSLCSVNFSEALHVFLLHSI